VQLRVTRVSRCTDLQACTRRLLRSVFAWGPVYGTRGSGQTDGFARCMVAGQNQQQPNACCRRVEPRTVGVCTEVLPGFVLHQRDTSTSILLNPYPCMRRDWVWRCVSGKNCATLAAKMASDMNRSTVFIIALFTSVLTAAGTSILMPRLLPQREPPRTVMVPALSGLSEADARTNLQALGLVTIVGRHEPNGKAAPDTVIGQSLAPGQLVQPGQAVSITLAAALPKVPDVAGRTVEEAKRVLEEAGYAVQVGAPLPDPTIKKGMVVAQSPKAGTALEAKSAVVVQPSAGPDAVEVPKLVGSLLPGAKANLEKAGLKVAPIQWVDLGETASYLVLGQKPEPGTKLPPGSEVTLTVNRGD
jgi:beta-lactam-binding protein with PASTA domain